MKKTLLTLAAVLLVGCASDPEQGGNNNPVTPPDTGKPTVPVREQDVLLIRDWMDDGSEGGISHYLTIKEKYITIVNGKTAAETKVNHTRSEEWYTEKGVLYIRGMTGQYISESGGKVWYEGQFTGDAEFIYTIKDSVVSTPHYALRYKLWLTPIDREEFEWIRGVTFYFDRR